MSGEFRKLGSRWTLAVMAALVATLLSVANSARSLPAWIPGEVYTWPAFSILGVTITPQLTPAKYPVHHKLYQCLLAEVTFDTGKLHGKIVIQYYKNAGDAQDEIRPSIDIPSDQRKIDRERCYQWKGGGPHAWLKVTKGEIKYVPLQAWATILHKKHYIIWVSLKEKVPDTLPKTKGEIIELLGQVEKYSKRVIDSAKGPITLSMKHHPPTFDRKIGGYLEAGVMDAEGYLTPGKMIFFSIEPGTSLDEAVHLLGPLHPQLLSPNVPWARYYPPINWNNYEVDITTAGGLIPAKLFLSYVHPQRMSLPALARILNEYGKVEGTIQVLVFDKLPHEVVKSKSPAKVVCSASIPVKLTCVAKIFQIGSTSASEKPKVRVMGIDPETDRIIRPSRGVWPKDLEYELIPGDIIFLDENDVVHIKWLNGTRTTIMTKPSFLEKDEFAKVHIGTKMSWYRLADKIIKDPVQALGVGVTGSVVVGLASGPAGAVYTVGYGTFVFG